jgi:hypothetical protein
MEDKQTKRCRRAGGPDDTVAIAPFQTVKGNIYYNLNQTTEKIKPQKARPYHK